MIEIGKKQSLNVDQRIADHIVLKSDQGDLVTLHTDDVTEGMKVGDLLEVFIYLNKEDDLVATTKTPLLQAERFAYLDVVSDSRSGAFVDIGLDKDLYVPKVEQYQDLEKGDKAVIYMYFDVISQKLVGSSRYDEYTEVDDIDLEVGQEVSLLVVRQTDLGYVVIIDQTYEGLIYNNDIFTKISIGSSTNGYVRKIREDGKIDVSLRPFGYRKVGPELEKIMAMLTDHDGILYYNDKSDADVIRDIFGMSKKVFKKSIGALYKQKLIVIEPDCIRLP